MSRSTRSRFAATTSALALSAVALAACGTDIGSTGANDTSDAGGLDQVTITGQLGKAPKVDWAGQVNPGDIESEVITEGDGAVIKAGEGVFAHLWIGNGFSEQEAFSSYESGSPELLMGGLSEPLREAIEGHKIGSRVAVASTAEEAFGEVGNAQLDIGNKDGVVFVVDLLGVINDAPSGEDREQAKWAPTLVETDGVITGLDFTEANRPSKNLLDTTLVKGDGPVVESGQTLAVDYLGQVYNAENPFDETYSADPASFTIGGDEGIPGWNKELVGKTVGSRVILSVPPAEGYGEKGDESLGIKGTDTVFFVVDILGAV